MGHYKVAARNEMLANVHTIIINIAVATGHVPKRWKVAVDIMAEKDKGSPKIHRLRIIQIIEADLNFCLSTIYGKRMMAFAAAHCNLSQNQYGSR